MSIIAIFKVFAVRMSTTRPAILLLVLLFACVLLFAHTV